MVCQLRPQSGTPALTKSAGRVLVHHQKKKVKELHSSNSDAEDNPVEHTGKKGGESETKLYIVWCPYCSGKFRIDLLETHMMERHHDSLWSRREVRCPKCGKGYEPYGGYSSALSNLKLHIFYMHKQGLDPGPETSETLQENSRLWSLFARELLQNLVSFLKDMNYETESFDKYIIARKGWNDLVLIKVEDRADCEKYSEFKRFVLTSSEFKALIQRLDQSNKITRGSRAGLNTNLNTDVITRFGWHAYEDEETRHSALEWAAGAWGKSHILNLLSWLKNTWPKNPKLSQYADVVEFDYNWFEKQCQTMFHGTPGARLIAKIKAEMSAFKTPIWSQRLLRSGNFQLCFVVTS
jgi:hypothetical protein